MKDCIRIDGDWFRSHPEAEWYIRDPIKGEPFGPGKTPETTDCVKVIVFKLFPGLYTRKPLSATLMPDKQKDMILVWDDRAPERVMDALKRLRSEVISMIGHPPR